jgi:hypothetical protein
MGTIFHWVQSCSIISPLAEIDDGGRWLAWSCDAIDFFNVSLSVTNLQAQFHQPNPASIVCHDFVSLFVITKTPSQL